MNMKKNAGFTLVELLIAMALGLILLGGLYQTFRTQHDTYIVQDQVAAMQQNLRAAMYLITRDLQMAGWYTNFDRNNHSIDWDDLDGDRNHLTNTENFRPLLVSHDNNAAAGDDIRDGTDMLVIVKAETGSNRTMGGSETAGGTTINIDRTASGLNNTTSKYGLLVKTDLSSADFFVVNSASGTITNPWALNQNYLSGDTVFRTDIIVYKIDEDANRPTLRRGNLGAWNGYQEVAENIENMQVRYQLNNGTWVNDVDITNQGQVRAVEVILVGRTAFPQRGFTDPETYSFANNPNPTPGGNYRRKVLSTIVKTRNVGL